MVSDTLNPKIGLPDMGDFYYDAPDQESYFGEMDRHLNSIRRDRARSAEAYKFYEEEPPQAGADEQGQVFVFDINLGSKGISDDNEVIAGIKVDDGDTLEIPIESIQVPDEKCEKYLSYIKGYVSTHNSDNKAETINLRFAGLDSKELPHFRKVPMSDIAGKQIEEVDVDFAVNNRDYIVSRYKSWMHSREVLDETYDGYQIKGTFFKYNEPVSGSVSVVLLDDGKYHQYFDDGGENAYVLVANATNDYDDATIADAGLARDVVVNALNDAEAMRIVIDGTQITRDGGSIKTMYGTDLYGTGLDNEKKRTLDMLFDEYTKHLRPGFNTWGQDAYGRCISAVYVKIKGKWINLNKLVIADTNMTEINKYNNGDQSSTVIDLDSYEYDAKDYADSLYADSKKFDDRQKVQKEIFGRTWEQLKDWTVTLGDVTLFVPPTSIRTLTQTKAERMPLVRAKGSMAKSATKNQRIIEMDLYFNEDRGINGYEYNTNTRPDNKGKDITYWMNGLRALYAQFRVAPFLPIENEYINAVLDVDAVTLISFSCETVPNFPKLIKATIQLAEFEYRIYMPEIPFDAGDDDSEELRNYFSKQINYPLFRYYYQRLLRNGEELKDTKFLDKKYIENTFGNKTCLIPAKFVNPYIKFYVPNKNQLEKLKKAKLERLARPNTVRDVSRTELDFADEMAKVKNEIDYINTSQNPIGALNDYLSSADMDGYVLMAGENSTGGIYKVNDDNTATLDAEKTQKMQELIGQATQYFDVGLCDIKREDGMPLCQKTGTVSSNISASDGSVLSVNMSYNIEIPSISEDSLNNLRTLATVSGSASADQMFVNRSVSLRISVDLGESNLKLSTANGNGTDFHPRAAVLGKGESLFYFDKTPDTNFLNFLYEVDNKQGVGGNEDANKAKASVDYVSAETLKFEPYNDDEDFLVEAIHLNTSNTFSQITLEDVTGYAPQYMGGTDVSMQISLYTQSKQAASAINALPHIAAEFARNYRLVLSAWPLKIESEFTKLFGITDTMIETAEVDTVPNYPGLYHITMTLVSVDRSLRNREALKAKDMENFHNLSVDGVTRERRWSYEKMGDFLSEAELYPDLELPTLKELGENGFNFIRYSNEKRIYPDPDFYFTYSHVLVSQLIRESILNALNSDACQVMMRDSMGKEINGSLANKMGSWERNYDLTKGWDKDLQTYFKGDDVIAARMISDFENVADEERDETWTVAPNIKIAMLEKRMINRINDVSKQSYQEKHGATIRSSTTYDNAAGVKQPETGQELKTGKNGEVKELVDAPETDSKKQGGNTTKENSKNLDLLKKQQAGIKAEQKDAEGSGKYSALIANKSAEVTKRVNSIIEHFLNTPISNDVKIEEIVQEVVKRLNSCNESSLEYGNINAFLEAAADAVCSNLGVDYHGDTRKASEAASDTLKGVGAGAATGAGAGMAVGGLAGAAIGGAVGAISGGVAGALADGNSSPNAPWKHCQKYRGRLKIDGIEQTWVFDLKDPNCKEKLDILAEKAVEFGYFNFKFYSAQELEDRFGYYGQVNPDIIMEEDSTQGTEANPRGGKYLADPYYRNANAEVQADYVRRCIWDFAFAKKAFLRICLLYMQVMVSYSVLPSFSYDVMRDTLDNEQKMNQILEGVNKLRKEKEAEANKATQLAKQYGTSKKWATKKKPGAVKEDASNAVSYVGEAVPEDTSNSDAKKQDAGNGNAQNQNTSNTDGKSVKAGDTDVASGKSAAVAKNVSAYKELFDKNRSAIDNGKLFLMIAMGVVDGDKDFLKMLMGRKYESLNAITNAARSAQTIKSNADVHQYETKLRSFIRALAGEEVIKNSLIGAGDTEAPSATFNVYNARQNVAAASEDPNAYMIHSFYDMVVHDCRGRMLRAFPTFYMFLVDEGRKIGKWRLHDNFYNVNAISSITISQSRKNPTDVAEIVMTNFYGTYGTEDEDINMNYTANFTDVFRSLWLPTLESYAKDEEERRTNAPKVERFRLRPGARIHIRLGYGADASHLPISFNGMIAEVATGDTVKLICQSDGVEICKPILQEKKASELQGKDEFVGWSSWCENGDTPKNIMRSLLCMKGGFINSMMHDKGYDDMANMIGEPINPLGIYHFGNPDIKYAGDAEPVQNIFEVGLKTGSSRYISTPGVDHKNGIFDTAANYAKMGEGYLEGARSSVTGAIANITGSEFAKETSENQKKNSDRIIREAEEANESATQLQFEVFGKTIWDVVNICRSTDPEYYAAVRPFHMRSTLFMGRGHDYYAYDYVKHGGAWIEKRKPFQQCHMYSSKTDIIDNQIAVSPKDIKTCAIGMYEVEGFMNAKVQKKTDPQWVDAAIYPEYQKTMYVDTKLFGEASRKLGIISDVIGWFTNGFTNSTLDRGFDKEGEVKNHHALAVKMTISALKDSMKEMYQGNIVLIGDPSVQPNDRMIINDTYNYIMGQCLVRDVVQVFSADGGYRTVVTPDLITSEVGSPAEYQTKLQQLSILVANVGFGCLAAVGELWALNKASGRLIKNIKEIKASEAGKKIIGGAKDIKEGVTNNALTQKAKNIVSIGGEKLRGMKDNFEVLKGVTGKIASIGGSALKVGGNILNWGLKLAEIRKLFGPLAWASTIGLGVIEDMISSKFNSRKTLVIFPLQKFNKPYVGGIDGNIGTVYGAPNFSSEDGIQSMLTGLKNGVTEGLSSIGIADAGSFLFGAGGILDIHKAHAMSEMEKIANDEGLAQQVYRQTNNSQMNNFTKMSFNPLMPRMAVRKKGSVKKAQALYGISAKLPDDINVDDKLKQMRSIVHDETMKDFFTSGFFRVAAHEKGFTSDLSDKIECIYIKNPEKEEYNAINAVVDSNGCYDIPYLHKEAAGVLHDIVNRAFFFMAGTEQARDAYKWYEDNKDSFITLTSALKCGSDKNYESTGFSFILTASDDKSLKALSSAIDFINRQMAETKKTMDAVPNAIMEKKENGKDIFIVVYPPEG